PSWRRQGIGRDLHDLILRGRPEERATAVVAPAAAPAQHAFRTWGWRKLARTRDDAGGELISDVLVTPLRSGLYTERNVARARRPGIVPAPGRLHRLPVR